MTHYDHAVAMSLKLDRWSEDRPLKNYELEAIAFQERAIAKMENKQSLMKRYSTGFVTARICRAFERRTSRLLERFT